VLDRLGPSATGSYFSSDFATYTVSEPGWVILLSLGIGEAA
jgi:hypothetical protein